MNNADYLIRPLVEAQLGQTTGSSPTPDPTGFGDQLRARVARLEALSDISWKVCLDPSEDDPPASRFGLDRAGQTIAVDGRRVARLRTAAKLGREQLLLRVSVAGGSLSQDTLDHLEQSASSSVDQVTASALAVALSSPVDDIESGD